MITSATDLLTYSNCKKRYSFQRNNDFTLLTRLKPSQVLGSIRHKFEEEFSSRTLDASGIAKADWFEKVWSLRVQKGTEVLRSLWTDHTLPQPATWPYYYVCKIALERKFKSLVEDLIFKEANIAPEVEFFRKERRNYDFDSWLAPEIQLSEKKAEFLLFTKELGFFGILDEVSRDNRGQYLIKDYKLQVIQRQIENSPMFKQMQLYAYLVWVNYDSVPEVTLVDVNNNECKIHFNVSEIREIGTQASAVIESMKSSTLRLASPSISNCHYCPFMQVCDEYLDFQAKQFNNGDFLGSVALRGTVMNVITYSGQPYASFEIMVDGGQDLQEKVYISNILGWQSVVAGDNISIGGLTRKSATVWRANRFSTLLRNGANNCVI